jgi:hypothetical protein
MLFVLNTTRHIAPTVPSLQAVQAHSTPHATLRPLFHPCRRCRHNGRTVALKKIQIFEIADAKARADCIKEVNLLSSLNHPNVIQVCLDESFDTPPLVNAETPFTTLTRVGRCTVHCSVVHFCAVPFTTMLLSHASGDRGGVQRSVVHCCGVPFTTMLLSHASGDRGGVQRSVVHCCGVPFTTMLLSHTSGDRGGVQCSVDQPALTTLVGDSAGPAANALWVPRVRHMLFFSPCLLLACTTQSSPNATVATTDLVLSQ